MTKLLEVKCDTGNASTAQFDLDQTTMDTPIRALKTTDPLRGRIHEATSLEYRKMSKPFINAPKDDTPDVSKEDQQKLRAEIEKQAAQAAKGVITKPADPPLLSEQIATGVPLYPDETDALWRYHHDAELACARNGKYADAQWHKTRAGMFWRDPLRRPE